MFLTFILHITRQKTEGLRWIDDLIGCGALLLILMQSTVLLSAQASDEMNNSALDQYRTAPAPERMVRKVADRVLEKHPDPTELRFNWGAGPMLIGMMRAYHVTGDRRYLRYVREYADHHHQAGIRDTLASRGYSGHWIPGFTALELYDVTENQNHFALAEDVVQYIMEDAYRTEPGGLGHFSDGKKKHQLWVDTLYMACPVLARYGEVTGEVTYKQEAVRQLDVFSEKLQDPETGLFYHMWDERTGDHSPAFWGRGNGWVVLSYTEVLRELKKDSDAYRMMAHQFRKQLDGLVSVQDDDTGLWRTVLDAPETYLETSASAMILYSMVQARNESLIDVPYRETLHKGWSGLAQTVYPDGTVMGVSGGTGPSGKSGYQNVKRGSYTWGTGVFLMAASAYTESDLGAE